MDLIAQHLHSVTATYVANPGHLFDSPNPAARIVRIAEYEHRIARIGSKLFKKREINAVGEFSVACRM